MTKLSSVSSRWQACGSLSGFFDVSLYENLKSKVTKNVELLPALSLRAVVGPR